MTPNTETHYVSSGTEEAMNVRFFRSLWPHYSEEKECQPTQYILDEVVASMLLINLIFPHVLPLCNTTGGHAVEQQPWEPAAGSAQGMTAGTTSLP